MLIHNELTLTLYLPKLPSQQSSTNSVTSFYTPSIYLAIACLLEPPLSFIATNAALSIYIHTNTLKLKHEIFTKLIFT